MEKDNLTRRGFIRQAGFGLAVAAVGLAGCAPKEVVKEVPVEVTREVTRQVTNEVEKEVIKEVEREVPESPWPYANLDTEVVRKKGHYKYYEAGCAYATFAGIVEAMQETVGFPFTQVNMNMMTYGAGGVAGWGTTCGTLLGASAAISLVTDKATASSLINELVGWYTRTPFPSDISNQYAVEHAFLVEEYKTDKELPQSVSNSPLCHVSVTEWCRTAEMGSGSKERAERCGRMAGDVAAKAVELLNAHVAGSFVPVFELSQDVQGCTTCHSSGENYSMGQFTNGKMECTACHEPHN